jgi:hypothetical protein
MWPVLLLISCTPKDPADDPPPAEPPERVVLHEIFSGSNCGPCAPAADNIAAVLEEQEGKYAIVEYQIGSDPYITREAVNRRMFYLPGEETYGIPFVHADGSGFHPNNMDGEETPYSVDDFTAFAEVPTSLGITADVEFSGQTVNIDVTLDPWEDIEGENLRLMIAINENITYANVGSNGQTEFHNVFKKNVPDDNGTPLEGLTAGEQISLSFSHTFSGDYDEDAGFGQEVDHDSAHTVEEFDDLAVVVWVQDMDTWEVFNTTWVGHD